MTTARKIQHHWQLDVFKLSREGAKRFFQLSKRFPKEETYSLTDQGRRSSRSIGHRLPKHGGDGSTKPSSSTS